MKNDTENPKFKELKTLFDECQQTAHVVGETGEHDINSQDYTTAVAINLEKEQAFLLALSAVTLGTGWILATTRLPERENEVALQEAGIRPKSLVVHVDGHVSVMTPNYFLDRYKNYHYKACWMELPPVVLP